MLILVSTFDYGSSESSLLDYNVTFVILKTNVIY